MVHHDPIESGVSYMRDRGYEVDRPGDRGEPAALATPGRGARGPSRAVGDRPVALERLGADETDPTTVVERVAHAIRHGRFCLFVVDAATAATVRSVLTAPPGVAGVSTEGYRTFYNAPDRIRLADDSYALDRRFRPDYRWEEEPVGDGAVRLVLYDGSEVVAVLERVDALACPPPDAFPFHYRRGGDKRLHVADEAGRPAGSFGSIRAMRTAGFSPVPMPLVPEHTTPDGDLSDAWAVAVVDDERLTVRDAA